MSHLSPLLDSLWPYGMAVSRTLSFCVVLPGFGDATVTPKIRLLLALSMSACVTPLLVHQELMSSATSVGVLLEEVGIGVFLGGVVRLLIETLSFVGSIVGRQASLTNIMGSGFSGESQEILDTFFRIYFVTFVFATDLHHLFFQGLYQSYTFWPPGTALDLGDLSRSALEILGQGFQVAVRMGSPFLVFGVSYYVVIGLINRLVPRIPVFFVGRPAEIGGGLLVLMLSLVPLTTTFHAHVVDVLMAWFG